VLKSVESVERGYGSQCYRIIQLNKVDEVESTPINMAVIEELLDRVRKLELDNTFMKYQLKHKVVVAGKGGDTEKDFEVNRPEQQAPEVQVGMTALVSELKVLFNEDTNYKTILNPIDMDSVELLPVEMMTIEVYN